MSSYAVPQYWVYHIADVCGRIRYVGVTSTRKYRFGQHCSVARGKCDSLISPFLQWLKRELRAERIPTIEFVQLVKGCDPFDAERDEIVRQHAGGAPLLNTNVKGLLIEHTYFEDDAICAEWSVA